MTFPALRLALGASVLVLTAGAALSDSAPAAGTRLAGLTTPCTSAQAQAGAQKPLGVASTTARQTNAIRVRYAAAHAMPVKRTAPSMAKTGCSTPAGSPATAID